jgi:hypothetical protein
MSKLKPCQQCKHPICNKWEGYFGSFSNHSRICPQCNSVQQSYHPFVIIIGGISLLCLAIFFNII